MTIFIEFVWSFLRVRRRLGRVNKKKKSKILPTIPGMLTFDFLYLVNSLKYLSLSVYLFIRPSFQRLTKLPLRWASFRSVTIRVGHTCPFVAWSLVMFIRYNITGLCSIVKTILKIKITENIETKYDKPTCASSNIRLCFWYDRYKKNLKTFICK